MAVLRCRMQAPEQPPLRSSRVRRWLGHLFREWTVESWRPIAPAHAKPACLRVVTYNQWRVADHAIPAHNRKQFVKNYEKN